MRVCKKCKKKNNYTGSGICSNWRDITCGMECEKCIYNLPCEHKKR